MLYYDSLIPKLYCIQNKIRYKKWQCPLRHFVSYVLLKQTKHGNISYSIIMFHYDIFLFLLYKKYDIISDSIISSTMIVVVIVIVLKTAIQG